MALDSGRHFRDRHMGGVIVLFTRFVDAAVADVNGDFDRRGKRDGRKNPSMGRIRMRRIIRCARDPRGPFVPPRKPFSDRHPRRKYEDRPRGHE